MCYPNPVLVKKMRCNCNYCKGSAYNHRTKKWFTRGTNVYKDTQHKLWVKRIRRQKHTQGELILYSVPFTD